MWSGIRVGTENESGTGDLIDEEFRLYRYHQRLIGGKPNFGWQRNMIYSLTQQAIRDIAYWLAYVSLRPDRNRRLVSYPFVRARSRIKTLFHATRMVVAWKL